MGDPYEEALALVERVRAAQEEYAAASAARDALGDPADTTYEESRAIVFREQDALAKAFLVQRALAVESPRLLAALCAELAARRELDAAEAAYREAGAAYTLAVFRSDGEAARRRCVSARGRLTAARAAVAALKGGA